MSQQTNILHEADYEPTNKHVTRDRLWANKQTCNTRQTMSQQTNM